MYSIFSKNTDFSLSDLNKWGWSKESQRDLEKFCIDNYLDFDMVKHEIDRVYTDNKIIREYNSELKPNSKLFKKEERRVFSWYIPKGLHKKKILLPQKIETYRSLENFIQKLEEKEVVGI